MSTTKTQQQQYKKRNATSFSDRRALPSMPPLRLKDDFSAQSTLNEKLPMQHSKQSLSRPQSYLPTSALSKTVQLSECKRARFDSNVCTVHAYSNSMGLENVRFMNKIGCDNLANENRAEAKATFGAALNQLQSSGPLLSERLSVTARSSLAVLLKNINVSTCMEPEEQPDRSLYIYQRDRYYEGMHMYKATLLVPINASRSDTEATLLYNLGQTHVQSQQYNQAMAWFQLALQVLETYSSPIDEFTSAISFRIHHNLGNCRYRRGENETALEHMRQALILASRRAGNGGATLELAASYNAVAVLLFHKAHPSEASKMALDYLDQALASYKAVLGFEGECTKEVATVLSNIGRVYFLQSDFAKALEHFQRSLYIRQFVLESHSVDTLTSMFNVAQTQHRLMLLDSAMKYYREFLERAQIELGTDHRDFAAGLVFLSDAHRERKELPEAQVLLEHAIRCGRMALGESHPDLALFYNNLGSLSYELRDYDAALGYYMECAKIQSEFLELSHPHTVISLLNMAQIHKQTGAYKKAFKLYREVYNIHFENFGPSSVEVATTISSMALMKYLAKDYQVALNFYQEALRLHRERKVDSSSKHDLQVRDMDIASTLNSIGLILFKMNFFDFAKDAFVECLNIRKNVLGEDHRDIAIMIYNLATIYLEKGEDHTAMKLYSESLRVERRALGEKHPEISCTLQHLGQMHQEKGELEIAVEYFQEALDIERTVLSNTAMDVGSDGGNHGNTASTASVCKLLNLIGNIHLMCGRVDEMMQCFQEACHYGRHKGEGLIIAGHNFYGLSRLHPPSAASA